jgi:hypothetical protein
MRSHTTHHDGCDCVMDKIQKLEAENARLKEENARFKEAIAAVLISHIATETLKGEE